MKEEKKRAEEIEQDEVNRDATARDVPDACHWSPATMIRMMNLLLRRDAAFATMRAPRHSLQIMSATLCIFADYLNLGYSVEGLQALSRMRDKNVVKELFERFHKWEQFLKHWSFLPFTGHGGHESPIMLKLLTITSTLLDAKSPLLTAPIDPHKAKTLTASIDAVSTRVLTLAPSVSAATSIDTVTIDASIDTTRATETGESKTGASSWKFGDPIDNPATLEQYEILSVAGNFFLGEDLKGNTVRHKSNASD